MIYYTDDNHINSSIGKRGKKDATSNSRKEQLKEFRHRWYEESTTIQKVVELERMSQKPPDLWDIEAFLDEYKDKSHQESKVVNV